MKESLELGSVKKDLRLLENKEDDAKLLTFAINFSVNVLSGVYKLQEIGERGFVVNDFGSQQELKKEGEYYVIDYPDVEQKFLFKAVEYKGSQFVELKHMKNVGGEMVDNLKVVYIMSFDEGETVFTPAIDTFSDERESIEVEATEYEDDDGNIHIFDYTIKE